MRIVLNDKPFDMDKIEKDGIPSDEYMKVNKFNKYVCEKCNKRFPTKKPCGWNKGDNFVFDGEKFIRPKGNCIYELEHLVNL